jgi:DNA-binding phage protein
MNQIDYLQKRLQSVPNARPLAALAGLSERTIYRIRAGHSTGTMTTFTKIVKALDTLYPETKTHKANKARSGKSVDVVSVGHA